MFSSKAYSFRVSCYLMPMHRELVAGDFMLPAGQRMKAAQPVSLLIGFHACCQVGPLLARMELMPLHGQLLIINNERSE